MTGSTSSLAHSRRSDYGEDAKRCEQGKQRGGGGGRGGGGVGKGERAEERSLFFSLLSPGFKFSLFLTSGCTGYRLQAACPLYLLSLLILIMMKHLL